MHRLLAVLLSCVVVSMAAVSAQAAEGDAKLEPGTARATFAGGCFWCMEAPFRKLDGVVAVTSGYTGGHVPNPTYRQVSSGQTGHAEAIEVIYKPAKISYDKLLDVFWHNIDPTTPERQFCDSGNQYRTEIFVHDATQKKLAEASRAALQKSGVLGNAQIATAISDAKPFYAAEEYHQYYYRKQELRYRLYREQCGRDQRLQQLYGKKAGGE